MGEVVAISTFRDIEVMQFNLCSAEESYKRDLKRRLDEIEARLKEKIQQNARVFPRMIFGTRDSSDFVLLSVDHNRLYFSEEKNSFFLIKPDAENIFDPRNLVPLSESLERENILRDNLLLKELYRKCSGQ